METALIEEFLQKKNEFEQPEANLYNHYKQIVLEKLKTVKCVEDIIDIKELLRVVPYCASKVLLFRMLILAEEKYKNNL